MDSNPDLLLPVSGFLELAQQYGLGSPVALSYIEDNPEDPDVRIVLDYIQSVTGAKQE